MTDREILTEINRLEELATKKTERAYEFRESLTCVQAIVYDKDRVQTSCQGDTLSERIIRLFDMEREIDEVIDRLIELKTALINAAPDETSKEIRQFRLFNRFTWQQIADIYNKSEKWARINAKYSD